MLPKRCEELWQAYVQSENVRIRAQLTEALTAFLIEFKNAPDDIRARWTHKLARQVVDENAPIVIRMPLFREVLFPSLLDGFSARKPGCARWLAGFAQLLYKSPDCIAKLPESARTEHGLLLCALEVDPKDNLAKQRLLKILRSHFDYVLHELPAGVLYGQDGATVEQCAELEHELRFFKTLAEDCGTFETDGALFAEAEFHLRAYPQYLRTRKSGDTYERFLSKETGRAHSPTPPPPPSLVRATRSSHRGNPRAPSAQIFAG